MLMSPDEGRPGDLGRPWRILHVMFSLDPARGGPPMIGVRLAASQAALGHQVALLSYLDPARAEAIERAHERVPGLARLERHALPPPDRLELLLGTAARRRLRELLPRFDVVHLHEVWQTIYRVAGAECRRAGKPYLILLNGALGTWPLRQKRLKKKLAWRLGYRRLVDSAAALHAGNEDERRELEPLRLQAPSVIVPNGISLEDFEPLPARGSFLAGRPWLAGQRYLLFLGRLHHKKGLLILAAAFAELAPRFPDLHLVVAGPDDGEREPFERAVAAAGLGARAHLVGPLYGTEKYAALVDSVCFCLPSHQEGFSVAILEALGCGVPVVISPGCHFPEVAEAGAGFVVPQSPTEIAGAVARLLSDEDLRREMAQNARALAVGRYLWSGVAVQTLEAYRQFCRRAT
jgi:glycosyltransferase involved in cell wall biosynthesis